MQEVDEVAVDAGRGGLGHRGEPGVVGLAVLELVHPPLQLRAAFRTGRGSDLAGVITRADRRDGCWIINGAKTWSTWAFAADYGLCLARTDWDAPKHSGLTMFLVPLQHPGITINRIRQVNGSVEF